MSSIISTGLDRLALPTALLPLVKSHLRVDGTYDDGYITDAVRRAISWFERVTNVSVNPVTWIWTPAQTWGPPAVGSFYNSVATVPVTPVNSFAVADSTEADISAGYTLTTMSTHGVGLYALNGAWLAGMTVSIPSGYADETELDPGITDAVLRYCAHLYENREILVAWHRGANTGLDDRRHRHLLDAARMKTVELFRDFDYHAHPRKTVRFHAGCTYSRVLELAAHEIERHGAGRIISPPMLWPALT